VTVRRLQHVSIAVPEARAEECAAFYVEVLGMERIPNPVALVWLRFGDGDHLHIMDGEANADSTHFALQVDDLEETLERARQAGRPTDRGEELWGAERWFTRDPAGNRVELFETPPG
jgi:catechol 2,3-dioxygenase-like lactoylglutathione lyase family enzyme